MRARQIFAKLCGLFGNARGDEERAREIAAHLALLEEEFRSHGMTADEARRQAHIRLGNSTVIREEVREMSGVPFIESLWRDVAYALRQLRKSPGFAIAAILVMAIGIGASAALFTVVRSILLRPLPFPNPDRLIAIYGNDSQTGNVVASGDFYDWQKASRSFEQMAIWRWTGFNMSGAGGELPEFLNAGSCSWNFFSTLGVNPVLGRSFAPSDDRVGAARTAILSWSFFERRFSGDPSILGKTIRLNSLPYTVIGVLPRWLQYPDPKLQLWVPWQVEVPPQYLQTHYMHLGFVVARLKPRISEAAATEEVSAIEHGIYLKFNGGGPVAESVISRPLLRDVTGDVRTPLYVLLAAVICLLLIACLNLSNLLVARSVARRREMAIRSALGSSRMRLIGQQMTESLLICIAGGVLGMALAVGATQWLTTYWVELPRTGAVRPDGMVLAFAIVITLLAGMLSGLVPAFSTSGAAVLVALQEGARGIRGSASRATLRRALLSVEIALTVVLLVTAGLLFRSFLRLRSVDLGCTTKNVLTLNYFLRGDQYSKPDEIIAFDTQLLEKVRHLPGVEAAGLTNCVPGDGYYGDREIWIPEHPPLPPGDHRFAAYRTADPGYFSAMEIPLIRGRFFTEEERLNRDRFVIVNQDLVYRYFPNEDPIGKHLKVDWRSPAGEDYEIIGVVGDTLYQIDRPVRPMMWFPILSGIPGRADDSSVLVVRGKRDVASLAIPIQKVIAQLDPDLPVKEVLTMQQIVGESTANSSFSATLVLAFAGLSLLLAAVGMYGVLSYLVTQRTQEIGIRMALGAERERVLLLVLLDGLRPALVGLVLGVAASAAVTRLIRSVLYGTSPLDATVFVSVIATLLLAAFAACLLPAWRATRIDPMQALRME